MNECGQIVTVKIHGGHYDSKLTFKPIRLLFHFDPFFAYLEF